MNDTDETDGAALWIVQRLRTDAALLALVNGIHDSLAPQAITAPYIVFSVQTATDENAVNGTRGATSILMLVKAITTGDSFSGAGVIARKADLLLHKQSGTVIGWKILECVREQAVRYPEVVNGQRFNHRGGIYRLWVEASA